MTKVLAALLYSTHPAPQFWYPAASHCAFSFERAPTLNVPIAEKGKRKRKRKEGNTSLLLQVI